MVRRPTVDLKSQMISLLVQFPQKPWYHNFLIDHGPGLRNPALFPNKLLIFDA